MVSRPQGTQIQITPKHPKADCNNCPLAVGGQYVPTKFPDVKPEKGSEVLAFIGEAPAQYEVRGGEPFIGPSGQLLNVVLQNYGIDRSKIVLTNVAACRYPSSFSELPPAAIEACRSRLLSELDEAGVTTAVVMGNSAAKGLVTPGEARRGITKLRVGPPRSTDLVEGVSPNLSIVPTFHPAACLRDQSKFPLMLADIGKAISSSKPTSWYEPKIVVVDPYTYTGSDIHQLILEITELNRNEGLNIDTESGRDKDTDFGRDDGAYGNVMCIGVGPSDPTYEHTVFVFTTAAITLTGTIKRAFENMLDQCGIKAQNGKYDIGVLMKYFNRPPDRPFPLLADPMLASYALNETSGIHNLEYMGVELLGAPKWKHVIKGHTTKEAGYGAVPKDILHKYNALDTHVLRLLMYYFGNHIEEQGLTQIYNFLLRVSKMLTCVESRGMGFDMAYSSSLEEELLVEIDELEDLIPVNPRSPLQIKKYLASLKIRVKSTDEETLIALMSNKNLSPHVKLFCERILAARKVSKLKGTYVTGLQKRYLAEGTIHPSFLIHGTTTGRLSARKPNTQNVPRAGDIKRQFIPSRKDHVLMQADFSQAELRVLTWLARDEGMRDLFNDPTQDVFYQLCIDMIPGFENMGDVLKTEYRTLIKTFAYGVSYGRTAEGVASDSAFNMTVAQAQVYMDNFNAMIPAIKEYQRGIIHTIHEGKDLINPFGRHRRFYLITDLNRKDVENEALAYMPQSTASDICLEAACRLNEEGLWIVNLVHDSIMVETLPNEADDIGKRMDEVMCGVAEEVTGGYVRFATEHTVGRSWYDLK